MSQLVRLEGKHTAQTAHCAVMVKRERERCPRPALSPSFPIQVQHTQVDSQVLSPSWSTTFSMGLRIIRLQFSKFWFHKSNHRSFIIYERVKCSPDLKKIQKHLITSDNLVQIFQHQLIQLNLISYLKFISTNFYCLII